MASGLPFHSTPQPLTGMGIRDAALISEMQEGYYCNDVLRSEPTAVLPSLAKNMWCRGCSFRTGTADGATMIRMYVVPQHVLKHVPILIEKTCPAGNIYVTDADA